MSCESRAKHRARAQSNARRAAHAKKITIAHNGSRSQCHGSCDRSLNLNATVTSSRSRNFPFRSALIRDSSRAHLSVTGKELITLPWPRDFSSRTFVSKQKFCDPSCSSIRVRERTHFVVAVPENSKAYTIIKPADQLIAGNRATRICFRDGPKKCLSTVVDKLVRNSIVES